MLTKKLVGFANLAKKSPAKLNVATSLVNYQKSWKNYNNSSRNFSNSKKRFVSYSGASFVPLTFTVGAAIGLYFMNKDEENEVHAASNPQATVVSGVHPHGGFVILKIDPKADVLKVAAQASKISSIVAQVDPDSVKPTKPGDMPPVIAGVAFGTQIWEKISSSKKLKLPPGNYGQYVTRSGKYGDMPATGGDILLHVKGATPSLCYEVVNAFVDSFPKGTFSSVDDKYSFQFQEGRDLGGFLDGTENPSDYKSRVGAAILSNGGSYVIHQRWIHNLSVLAAQTEPVQESWVGRTKPDSAELNPLPAGSHVARMRDEKGNKIPVVRQSMPFGTVGGDRGLLFIAYSNDVKKFDTMMDQMVGKKNGTENDSIMRYSKCVASNYYYVPSVEELAVLQK